MARYWPSLLLLAAIWGGSYLFIKVAVEDIPPAAMTELRLLIAGALLTAYLALRVGARGSVAELRAAWLPCLVLGTINAALPMTLVAWGETHIDSSIAAITQSSVPIFVVLLSLRFLPHEPLGTSRITGLAIGLAGVALVTGVHPEGNWWAVAGTLAVVLSSLSYASGGVYGQLQVHGTSGPVLAAGSMLAGALILLPFAVADPPTQAPGATAIAGLAALILLPTVLGQLLLFRMLRLFGSRRMSLVTYLMPGFAVVYGAVLLDEPATAAALGGLALILVGVALASGQRLLGTRVQENPA
ncbi:MAG TPA: EamA family transporter [Gaiellaceae bacterium]|nr:EamA family transporter [Gaiellaceae bacterium]